jgi:cellulose biosynthesis protein BcsQ
MSEVCAALSTLQIDWNDVVGITIAVGNLKNGVGSTVLTSSLAVLLQSHGAGVAMIEREWLATLTDWSRRREAQGLGLIPVANVAHGADAEPSVAAYLLVDCRATEGLLESMLVTADIWLVPAKPGSIEVEKALQLFARWQDSRVKRLRRGIFALVFARVEPQAREQEWAARAVLASSHPELLILNRTLRYDPVWDETYAGHGITELEPRRAGIAIQEFTAMASELICRSAPVLSVRGIGS